MDLFSFFKGKTGEFVEMTKEIGAKPSGCKSRRLGALNGLYGVRLVRDVGESVSTIEAAYAIEDFHQEATKSRAMLLESEPLCEAQGLRQWAQLPLKRLWQERPNRLKGYLSKSHGDSHFLERLANVLTSMPFIFIGLGAPREKFVTKLYANSTIGVGLASTLYHCSSGERRIFFKRMDYMMIATSAVCLSKALRPDSHKVLMAASALLLPFQPLLVTALHTGILEATFAERAQTDPWLRKAHRLHVSSYVVGCGLFIADDLFPEVPFVHACWHLAAALCVATSNKLLE